MRFKKLLTSVCLVPVFCLFLTTNAYAKNHLMIDKPANSLLTSILGQEVADVVVKTADLATFVKKFLSMGDLGAIVSDLSMEGILGSSFVTGITDAAGLSGGIAAFSETVSITQNTINDAAGQLKDQYDNIKSQYDDVQSTINDAKDQFDEAKGAVTDTIDSAKGVVSDAKNQINSATSAAKKLLNKATKTVGNISVPSALQGMGFEKAMSNPKEMAGLVAEELLPKVEDPSSGKTPLTDLEKKERELKRLALRDAAVADAYALSVATQYEGTSVKESSIDEAQKKVNKAETLQEKAGAALDVGLARAAQLIRGNEIAAMSLRLMAAEAIAKLPRDYGL